MHNPIDQNREQNMQKQFFMLQRLQTVSVGAASPDVHEHAWNYKGLAARARVYTLSQEQDDIRGLDTADMPEQRSSW
jgi:hypothetical protein